MSKRRKYKGSKPNYNGNYGNFHHNSNKKSPSWQSPLGIVSDRQQAVMDVLIKAHQHLTGDDLSFAQIDQLSVRYAKALLKAKIDNSPVLEIEWLDWCYHLALDWCQQGCPPSGLLSGLLGMTALTARGGRINASLARHH